MPNEQPLPSNPILVAPFVNRPPSPSKYKLGGGDLLLRFAPHDFFGKTSHVDAISPRSNLIEGSKSSRLDRSIKNSIAKTA